MMDKLLMPVKFIADWLNANVAPVLAEWDAAIQAFQF